MAELCRPSALSPQRGRSAEPHEGDWFGDTFKGKRVTFFTLENGSQQADWEKAVTITYPGRPTERSGQAAGKKSGVVRLFSLNSVVIASSQRKV